MGKQATQLAVIIVGGGASGVILASHLLRNPANAVRVTLIERRARIGRGVAYGSNSTDHLLNVRPRNMSPFADDPDHFLRWLVARGALTVPEADAPYCFLPRYLYGEYLDELAHTLGGRDSHARLNIVHAECIGLTEMASGVEAVMADGSSHVGHVAVLATGHDEPAEHPPYTSAWTLPKDASIPRDAAVLIRGTGLSMVDYVIALQDYGHRGPILAISRRGQTPRVHRLSAPLKLDSADIPLGTEMTYFFHWFRELTKWAEARGGDWRDAVDAMRPLTQKLWQSWPLSAKKTFMEHARPWWEVHRHRIPPQGQARIDAAVASGQLSIVAAKIRDVEPTADGAKVVYRRRGHSEDEVINVARVVECTGIVKDPTATENPVLKSLFADGAIRADPLGIGIDVSSRCSVISRDGQPSSRLFAAGPITRAAFWEITAVPDIRVQCEMLAKQLLGYREDRRSPPAP
jgi:uncharacterized NAD(P)/FAD-binding protein YdhS